MRITEISLHNVMGLRGSIKVNDIGLLLELWGSNGSGKSSFLTGVKAGLGLEGSLENVQNVHADGEAETELHVGGDDDPAKYKLKRKGSKLWVEERVGGTEAYEKLKRPAEFVKGLIDEYLVDPLKFVRADPDRQADLFLEALPIELPAERISGALGALYAEVLDIVGKGGAPIKVLAAVSAALYETRKGINTSHREMLAAAKKMKEQIPAHLDDSDPVAISAIEKERDAAAATVSAAKGAATAAYEKALAQMVSDFKAFEQGRRLELSEAISKLSRETDVDIARERDACAVAKAAIEGTRDAAMLATAADQKAFEAVTERLTIARTTADSASKFKTLKEQADTFDKQAEGLGAKALTYTAGLEAVEALKVSLLADAPVAGLTVDDGEVKINAVPLRKINKEAMLSLACDIAIMRAKKKPLPLVILDDGEAFDNKHKQALQERFEAAGVQVAMTFVSRDELELEVR